ncbi:MAG: aldehyde dehydrogenase [Chloroflexi bacterium]|nr:aldehyde dehydrogenase [Chloroflexota bacterium]
MSMPEMPPIPTLEEIQPCFELFDYIDGEKITPSVDMGKWITTPNSGDKLAPMLATSKENVERALATAAKIHAEGTWSNTPADERADLLDAAAGNLMAKVPLIAGVESYSTGVVINLTMFVNAIVWLAFKAAAGVLRSGYTENKVEGPHGDVSILRKPLGPAVCIVPWNSPAALAAHKVANALAAGCPVILKPSEFAPFSTLFLVDALAESGLPKGVFQIVNGGAEVGSQLTSDKRVRAVSFTGGLQGGRAVAQACSFDFKSVQLELGGNNAMVVLEDADIEKVADGIVEGMTTLNGQWCRALGRLLIHESIVEDVVARAKDKLALVNLGDSLSPESKMGPVVHAEHLGRLQAAIDELVEKGGMVHQSTPKPELSGFFLPPTLITGVAPEDTLEEVFGPVATVHTFKTDAEAISLANQTPYGLGGYVFSQDEERALKIGSAINTGGVKVNGVSLLELNVDAPRPAWGLSGAGEEGTLETFDVFCGKSVVGVAAK